MSKPSVETITSAVDKSAERYGEASLFFSRTRGMYRQISFCEIVETSKRYAYVLQRSGLRKGDLVGLLLSTSPEFVFSLIGIIRAGGVPVPLPSYSGVQSFNGFLERLAYIINSSNIHHFITDRQILNSIQDHAKKDLFTRQTILMPEELGAETGNISYPIIRDDDLCLVQYTSGSTSSPKGVALTHRNILAGIAAIAHGIQVTKDDIWCTWLPLYHDMGLIGLLCGMVNGVSQYLHLPRSFIANPAAWLREFSRLGATGYTGPNFSYAQMLGSIDDDQAAELDLSRWRIAFNGSEPIDPLVVEQFLSRFSRAGFRPQSMLPVYGLAEATLPVTFPTIGSPPLIQWVDGKRLVEEGVAVQVARTSKLAKGVVSVGKSVLNHMVRIVDPSGTEIPENNVGEIQVKGPAIMSGYYANPEATAAVMRDGWLSTGDLGYVSEDLLFITGRAKEIIIVNGSKFYPEDVEELVRNVNGVYQNRCVAFGYNDGSAEQMIVAAETGLGTDIEKQALVDNLRTLICNQLGLFAVRIHLLKCGGIPRTSSGKYQRLLLRERLEKADSNRE